MSANNATNKIATAIQTHLTRLDAVDLPDATRLAGEITAIVWAELAKAGLNSETLESYFQAGTPRSRAQGKS